jgi:peptidoglycan/LPS O-acetylase OafA/YrhL
MAPPTFWTSPLASTQVHVGPLTPGLSPDTRPFRQDIEGLRGVAVLLVVAYHVGIPIASAGFIGVDIFFVLSGYLITGILLREVEHSGRLDLISFFARRARRLLPAAGVMIFTTLAVGFLLFTPLERLALSGAAQASALYVSNFWFMEQVGGYFAGSAERNPLLHTWSLAVEEQFYFVWPIFVALAFRGSRLRLAVYITLLSIFSFGLCIWLTEVHTPWAFYSSPARTWEFALGALASLLPVGILRRWARWLNVLGWVGLAAIVAAACTVSPIGFPGSVAMIPVLGTVAVLIAGAQDVRGASRLLCAAPLQMLGRLSYSWYLWHWPALVFMSYLVPSLSTAGRSLVAVGALGIAAATYVLVESPLRFNKKLLWRPRLSIAAALVATLVGAGISAGAVREARAATMTSRFGPAASDLSRVFADGCVTGFAESDVRHCAYGDTLAGDALVVFGDSHAAQWIPALETVATQHGLRLVPILKTSCPSVRAPIFLPRIGQVEEECARWREEALRRIREISPVAVVTSSYAGFVIGGDPGGDHGFLTPEEWRVGWRSTLEHLDSAAVPVLLLRDIPIPGFHVPNCLQKAERRMRNAAASCAVSRASALNSTVYQAEVSAAMGLPQTHILDFSDLICGEVDCPVLRGDTVVFQDSHHITATFAASLASELGRRLSPHLRPPASSPSDAGP